MTIVPATYEELKAELERRRHNQTIEQEAELLSGSLRRFIHAAWHVIEPDTVFIPGWHIDAICDHLEAVSDGEIRRLIILVPPGTMKSRTVSVLWPAWEWTRDPRLRYLTASYAQQLSTDLAVLSRDLIRSRWYQLRWGHIYQLKSDANLKMSYSNNRGGRRFATSVGGGGTGQHANRIIIDDPLNAQDAVSNAALGEVKNWHDGTISMRFADPRTGSEVIIMQRLHEQDLVGHVMNRDGGQWQVLCLPEEYEPKHPFVTPETVRLTSGRELQGDLRSQAGELLWPAHMDEITHAERKLALGSFRAAGQLQQRPSAPQGNILQRNLWRYYDASFLADERIGMLPRFTRIVTSWDTAFKDKTTSDFVVGATFGVIGADRYLLRLTWARLDLTATCTALEEHYYWAVKRWPQAAHNTVVENTANGPDVIATMKRRIPGVVPWPAKGDKTQRAIAASPDLEAGNVFLPGAYSPELDGADPARTPAIVQDFIETCAKFPYDEHDDAVDAFSQAINWLRSRGSGETRIASPAQARINQPRSIPQAVG